jgi:hypothetical protein
MPNEWAHIVLLSFAGWVTTCATIRIMCKFIPKDCLLCRLHRFLT